MRHVWYVVIGPLKSPESTTGVLKGFDQWPGQVSPSLASVGDSSQTYILGRRTASECRGHPFQSVQVDQLVHKPLVYDEMLSAKACASGEC